MQAGIQTVCWDMRGEPIAAPRPTPRAAGGGGRGGVVVRRRRARWSAVERRLFRACRNRCRAQATCR